MMNSRETFYVYETTPRMEVFSRVEASFDRAFVDHVGKNFCRILEEIENTGVEIIFRKGQHVLCGTLKQIQYIEDQLCGGLSVGDQHSRSSTSSGRETCPASGRPFESLPAQYNSSSNSVSAFDKRSSQRGAYSPYSNEERGGVWNKSTDGATYPGMQSSYTGLRSGARLDGPAEGEYYGNVPSDYSETKSESVEQRNLYKVNRDRPERETTSDTAGKKVLEEKKQGIYYQSNYDKSENSGAQLKTTGKEEMLPTNEEKNKSAAGPNEARDEAGSEKEPEGLFQELMVDRDIWDYIEVKMPTEWTAIQEFGAKIDKIVDESGMVKLRITPMTVDTDDSDTVGLVHDSLAGLYNNVQARIIMEVLHLTPLPENGPVVTMVMQYIKEQYPHVHLKCCPQRDHFYFIGPLTEVYVALRMFQFAFSTAIKNEIILINQLHETLLAALRNESEGNSRDASGQLGAPGDDLGATGSAYPPVSSEHRYEGMATSGSGNPLKWNRSGGQYREEDAYEADDYAADRRSERHDNGQSAWYSYSKSANTTDGYKDEDGFRQNVELLTGTQGEPRTAGDDGDYNNTGIRMASERFGTRTSDELNAGETSWTSMKTQEYKSARKQEDTGLTGKRSDYIDGDVERVEDTARWGSIRMKSESANTEGKRESFEPLQKVDQEHEQVIRDCGTSSLSRLKIETLEGEADVSHSLGREDVEIIVKQSENDFVNIGDAKSDLKDACDIDSDDEDDMEDVDVGKQGSKCATSKLQTDFFRLNQNSDGQN